MILGRQQALSLDLGIQLKQLAKQCNRRHQKASSKIIIQMAVILEEGAEPQLEARKGETEPQVEFYSPHRNLKQMGTYAAPCFDGTLSQPAEGVSASRDQSARSGQSPTGPILLKNSLAEGPSR